MSIHSDFHLHSYFSGDCKIPMEQMIQAGIVQGLSSMCFTEHKDPDFVYVKPEEEGMFELNTDSYLYELATLKAKYADKIKLLFGVELGLQPHLKRELAIYAKSFPFDFIIGSSHICNRKDPYDSSFYEGRDDEEAYREYFLSILDNLKAFDNFDVYGHLDYVVRYGKTMDKDYSYDKYKDILDKILQTIIDKEKGIEINTGGLRRNLKDVHPCTDVIRRYKELGGEIITVGSDAHTLQDIAYSFDRVNEILLSCGFKYYTTFENRMPEYHRL